MGNCHHLVLIGTEGLIEAPPSQTVECRLCTGPAPRCHLRLSGWSLQQMAPEAAPTLLPQGPGAGGSQAPAGLRNQLKGQVPTSSEGLRVPGTGRGEEGQDLKCQNWRGSQSFQSRPLPPEGLAQVANPARGRCGAGAQVCSPGCGVLLTGPRCLLSFTHICISSVHSRPGSPL